MRFETHTVESAPAASSDALGAIAEKYGFVPNLAGVFATSPGALEGLLALLGSYDGPNLKLNPIERQVVLLAVSVYNRCEYCTAAHSMVASGLGLEREQIDRLQNGGSLSDARLEALRQFATSIAQTRGRPAAGELERFAAAGFDEGDVLEVILGVAVKTLTNYANHIAQVEVNEQFAGFLPPWTEAA